MGAPTSNDTAGEKDEAEEKLNASDGKVLVSDEKKEEMEEALRRIEAQTKELEKERKRRNEKAKKDMEKMSVLEILKPRFAFNGGKIFGSLLTRLGLIPVYLDVYNHHDYTHPYILIPASTH